MVLSLRCGGNGGNKHKFQPVILLLGHGDNKLHGTKVAAPCNGTVNAPECSKYIDELLVDQQCYELNKFTVQKPNTRYNSDPVELILRNDTEIAEAPETDVKTQYINLKDAKMLDVHTTVNVLGKVISLGEVEAVPGKGYNLRNIHLYDGTGSAQVTLFGNMANTPPGIHRVKLLV